MAYEAALTELATEMASTEKMITRVIVRYVGMSVFHFWSALQLNSHRPRRANRAPRRCLAGEELYFAVSLTGRFHLSNKAELVGDWLSHPPQLRDY
jgi:hypothetical protein